MHYCGILPNGGLFVCPPQTTFRRDLESSILQSNCSLLSGLDKHEFFFFKSLLSFLNLLHACSELIPLQFGVSNCKSSIPEYSFLILLYSCFLHILLPHHHFIYLLSYHSSFLHLLHYSPCFFLSSSPPSFHHLL